MAGTLSVRQPAQTAPPLPEVRQDLSLYPAEADEDGGKLWHLHDPISNRFFRMEERDIELLAVLGLRDAKEVVHVANRLLRARVNEEEVRELAEFLRRNNLVKYDETQKGHYAHALETMKQETWWEAMMRNPIVFRIPLWHPDQFLTNTLPWVRWVGSTPAIVTFVLATLIGFYLVSRQVDQFFTTFQYFFNLSGLAIYLATLFFVKVLHELGHAYVAKAMGCRVPVIGVAFLVGWPVFYTDTSDAWKIADHRKRLLIGSAGVAVELAVASISLLAWSLSPEGVMKSAFFLLATTTWILSVLVNFNPLMRFDGYYLFSDLVRMPNLERRSFTLARWRIREALFGLGVPSPEPYRPWMVVYAFAVWVYRFFLFLGIAILLHNYFFPAAGISLFIAEVYLLIVRPVLGEMREWWELREKITLNGASWRAIAAVSALLLLFFVPWRTDVPAPALVESRYSDVFLPESGQLVSFERTDTPVGEGDVIFTVASPELDHELALVKARYDELSWTQASLGFDANMRSEATVVSSALRTQNQRLRSLFEQRQQMEIKAPFDGKLVDVAPDIQPGDWLPKGSKMGTVVDRDDTRIIAYLLEDALSRVEEGMTARFYPENPEHPAYDATVREISFVGLGQLDKLYLASMFGGDIAVRETDDGFLAMVQSHYRVELDIITDSETPDPRPEQVVRGTVVIDGNAVSPFSQVRRQFVSLFIRETGFSGS